MPPPTKTNTIMINRAVMNPGNPRFLVAEMPGSAGGGGNACCGYRLAGTGGLTGIRAVLAATGMARGMGMPPCGVAPGGL
jgi:hypothetical protein